MAKIWIKVIRNHRIVGNEVVELDDRDVIQAALAEKLREMDLPSPIWLQKHFGEMERFYLTSFGADDFIEPVRFDKIDISLIDDGNETRRNKDPRNEF